MSEKSSSPGQRAEAEIIPSSPEFWREYSKTLCQSPETGRALDGRFWDKAAPIYDDLEFCRDYTLHGHKLRFLNRSGLQKNYH